MNCSSSHILLILLFLVEGAGMAPATPPLPATQEDSVRVEELLLLDTLDLRILGPSNDVAFYMNGLVFLSNTKFHQEMIPDHITFGQDMAYFVPLEYISLESSRPLFPNDPFPYSPAGMSFSRDYRTVYFTKPVAISGRRIVEKIFEMTVVNGEASRHTQLPFTMDHARYMHPAVSVDGEFMVFSSDRTPSSGGLDLFIVRKTAAGWSNPVNLGQNINTTGHEWFPFLDHNHNLYFSSSGHMGYGGYDVFVCPFNGTGWDEPRNLTELVNSGEDDLGFSIHPNKRLAAFSTPGGSEAPQGMVFKMELNKKAFLLTGLEDPGNQDISLLLEDMVMSGYTTGRIAESTEVIAQSGINLTAAPLLTEPAEEETPGEEQPEEEVIPEDVELEGVASGEEPVTIVVQETEDDETRQEEQPEEVTETTPAPQEEITATAEETIETEEPAVEEPVEEEPVLDVAETTAPEVEASAPGQETGPDPDQVVFRVQIVSSSKPNSNPTVTIGGTRYATWEYYYKGAYRVTVGEFTSVQEALEFRTRCKNSGYNQAFVAAFRNNERELDPAVFRR